MTPKTLMLGAAVGALSLAVLALAPVNAKTGEITHEAAIEACSAINPIQPVEAIGAVEDGSGIGFSLVWLNDAEGNLWMCDADDTGAVYSYTLVKDDLLDGSGAELIGLQLTSDGEFEDNPQTVAEEVCVAYLTDGGFVLTSASDGLTDDPGYVVFVENDAGDLFLCNATGDAMVWAFEPIGEPLSFEDGEAVS
ncbi:MAG: hypothetical protein ACRECX_11170 [Methyloceanibacter sp.]|uniref:hypothetical protein n=1 Tax=Methyloceanibacter sp. TaxID=1965321 RepID=UPI003D6DA2C4